MKDSLLDSLAESLERLADVARDAHRRKRLYTFYEREKAIADAETVLARYRRIKYQESKDN